MTDPLPDIRDAILIVDDAPENLEALRLILSKKGYRITTATDGEAALERISRQRPDLVLLDIGMPGMSGFEVCRRLKSDASTRRIPVLFLSARHHTDDKVHAFESGGVDYITKPFQVVEVLARIETHLTLRRYQQRLEAMVAARTRALAAANAAKSRFLMTMSHELRTPLNGVLTAADMAAETTDATVREEMIAIVQTAGRQLMDTVTHILDFADYEGGDMQVAHTDFQPADLLENLPRRFVHKGQVRELDLTVVVKGALPDTLRGDRRRLAFILEALLDNAAKFSRAKPMVTVSVHCPLVQSDTFALTFAVTDDGIGIHPDHHEPIFEPFFQVDTSLARHFDGVGMGLALCRRYARLMGGDIRVSSRPDRGSTFTIEAVVARG
jgi:signal transduction histidine kinase